MGYFFGPRYGRQPELDSVVDKRPADTVLIAKFGDLGLVTGKWPVLGRSPVWDRLDWPAPVFGRRDLIDADKAWRVQYREDDLTMPLRVELVSPHDIRSLPSDGLWGAGAIEDYLNKLLPR